MTEPVACKNNRASELLIVPPSPPINPCAEAGQLGSLTLLQLCGIVGAVHSVHISLTLAFLLFKR